MPTNEAIAAATSPVTEAISALIAHIDAKQRQSWYAINRSAESPAVAEVLIYDEIGAWGVDAKSFVTAVSGIDAKRINVRLNTPGGDVFDGTAIHNALRAHPAHVAMYVEGVAASAGSFIAMAGDEIQMADNAYLMIHNSAGGVMGGAGDMRTYADLLAKIDGNIAMMYAQKTGKSAEHYRELMDAETWFTAEEAKAEGLVDSVYTAKPAKVPAKARNYTTVYNKIPDGVRRQWESNQQLGPDDSQRSASPPAITKEVSAMPEPTQAAPASPPAAPSNVPTQGVTITEAENRRREVVRLNDQAIENFIAQGRNAGHLDGVKAERERCKEIAEACPGKPAMALSAILANNSAESVRLAYAAAVESDERARIRAEEQDAEIARWKALASNGGYPNGVPAGFAAAEEADDEPLDATTAKARAAQEWDQKPSVRKGFTNKDRYVAVRTAELTGQLRVAASRN